MRPITAAAPAVALLLPLLAGCAELGCEPDADLEVHPWEGTPGMGVTWEELGEDVSSFPRVEDLLSQAALAGNATGQAPTRELDAFESALDRAWQESGRPGDRPRTGGQNVVRYQGAEWNVTGSRVCA